MPGSSPFAPRRPLAHGTPCRVTFTRGRQNQNPCPVSDMNETLLQELRTIMSRAAEKHGHFDEFNTTNDWMAYITAYTGSIHFALTKHERRKLLLKVAGLALAAVEALDRGVDQTPKHLPNIGDEA